VSADRRVSLFSLFSLLFVLGGWGRKTMLVLLQSGNADAKAAGRLAASSSTRTRHDECIEPIHEETKKTNVTAAYGCRLAQS